MDNEHILSDLVDRVVSENSERHFDLAIPILHNPNEMKKTNKTRTQMLNSAMEQLAYGYSIPTMSVKNGNLVKVQHIPPNYKAIKYLMEIESDEELENSRRYEFMTREELIEDAKKILKDLEEGEYR